MLTNVDPKDLANELALWRKLSRLQDKLLAAYRLQKRPAEYVLDGIEKCRKRLEPYIQASVMRAGDNQPLSERDDLESEEAREAALQQERLSAAVRNQARNDG